MYVNTLYESLVFDVVKNRYFFALIFYASYILNVHSLPVQIVRQPLC